MKKQCRSCCNPIPVSLALLDSVTGDSPNILDVSIVDAKGLALLHTNPALQNTIVPAREDFATVLQGGIRQQLQADLWPGTGI